MLRLFVRGLLFSNIRRTAGVNSSHVHPSLLSASTCRNLNTMEQPFQKMEEEGVPQCSGPKEAEMKKDEEEKALPKLSKQEFRQYNSMAEHMNYFVCASGTRDWAQN
jgi:hypothetical protein